MAFAEEVSVTVICGVAVILVSAEDVSERVICGAAVILAFAKEVSVCESDLWRRSYIGVCRGCV